MELQLWQGNKEADGYEQEWLARHGFFRVAAQTRCCMLWTADYGCSDHGRPPINGTCRICTARAVLSKTGLCVNCLADTEPEPAAPRAGTPGDPAPYHPRPMEYMYLGFCRACKRLGRVSVAVTIADGNSACEDHL